MGDVRIRSIGVLAILGLALVACGNSSTPGGSGGGTTLSTPELQLAVLDAVGGHLVYCDPDIYPVARGTPVEDAKQRLPSIKADAQAYRAIFAHLHITDDAHLTDEQLVAINEAFKQMQAIELQPAGGDARRFDVEIPAEPPDSGPPTRVTGTVDATGTVHVRSRLPGRRPMCPICLAMGTLIATPRGPVAVQDLRPGMPVWTADPRGRRIERVVEVVGHTPTSPGHEVIRLRLADGRTVTASPGHPTPDGRTVGSLHPGDAFDGSAVLSARRIPYTGAATWDLLPSGPTGEYWANGVLLGSTLYGEVAGHTPAVSMA
jgi:hypothetical protein